MLHTACFTGHRPEKLHKSENETKELLKNTILQALSNGFTTFISGMAPGIDIWAAEIILEMRDSNPKIHLICAIPYDGFGKRKSSEEREVYLHITKCADKVENICSHYYRGCFQVRNQWMVDHSSLVISAYNGEKGGTLNTIKYANHKGVAVNNIFNHNTFTEKV